MKVKDILAKKPANVITISADDTLQDASVLLTEHNIGALVVVDKANAPAGILSERDIVRKIAGKGANALSMLIKDAMTADIIIGLMDDDLAHVSTTMTNKRIRHLPIMDNQSLVGMISIGDIVKSQLDYAEHEAHTLRQYITGGYN